MTPARQFQEILHSTAAEFGCTSDAILSKSRAIHIVKVRHLAIRRIRDAFPKATDSWIGRKFNKDRTTIRYALALPEEKTAYRTSKKSLRQPILVRELRADWVRLLSSEGWSRHDIAYVFNISETHISRIRYQNVFLINIY